MVVEVLVFMISLNCSDNFEPHFWQGFDGAMMDEWSIDATTGCYQVDRFPSSFADYQVLQKQLAIKAKVDTEKRIIVEGSQDSRSGTAIAGDNHVDFTTAYLDSLASLSTPSLSPQRLPDQNSNSVALQSDKEQMVFITQFTKDIFEKENMSGIAYPSRDIAFVRNDLFYTTKTLSHEILHLALQEDDNQASCYIDKVHANDDNLTLKEMGRGSKMLYPILSRFEC